MRELTLHPDCKIGPITGVSATIEATAQGCAVRFVLDGDIAAIKVPEPAKPIREDLLWQTTCAEIFWQPEGDTYYREFNLSPSGKWAVYDFTDFREGMANAPADGVDISCEVTATRLQIAAEMACDLPVPADVALNLIVEGLDGYLYNWALAFPPGEYEFHSAICRQFRVEDRP